MAMAAMPLRVSAASSTTGPVVDSACRDPFFDHHVSCVRDRTTRGRAFRVRTVGICLHVLVRVYPSCNLLFPTPTRWDENSPVQLVVAELLLLDLDHWHTVCSAVEFQDRPLF